jgi:hypothetical protein
MCIYAISFCRVPKPEPGLRMLLRYVDRKSYGAATNIFQRFNARFQGRQAWRISFERRNFFTTSGEYEL